MEWFSTLPWQQAVDGAENCQGIRLTSSQEIANFPLEFFQAVYARDQEAEVQTIRPVAGIVETPERDQRRKKFETA